MRKTRVIVYFILVLFFTLFNFYYRPIRSNPSITKEYVKSRAYINSLYKSDEYFKEELVDKDSYYIYEQMIKDVKKGVTKSKISCHNQCRENYLNSYYALYLDHPEFIAFQSATAYLTNDTITIHYDSLNPFQTYFGTRRIEREMDIIRRETKNMNEKEKILYVYDYVASHDYDRLFTYMSSNQSAYSFFTKGTSVCAGFAKASQLIFQNIGISSYLVMNNDHMWNYVEYQKKYYIFDATVGASYHNKENPIFYDGLGRTTMDSNECLFQEYYPTIESVPLREIFGV